MIVARALHGWRNGGEGGLVCVLGCRRLFRRAGEFVLHSCFQRAMREREEAARRPVLDPRARDQLLLITDLRNGPAFVRKFSEQTRRPARG